MIIDRNAGNLPQELMDIPDEEFELADRSDIMYDEAFKTKPIGFYRDALRRLCRNKMSLISFFTIVLIIIAAIIVPAVTGYTYDQFDTTNPAKELPPKIPFLENYGIADGTRVVKEVWPGSKTFKKNYPEGTYEIIREYEVDVKGKPTLVYDLKVDCYAKAGLPDNEYHWFGTDSVGRDLLTRLFRGVRISLLIGFISVLINMIIGVIYGSLSGYYGGKVDMILTHLAEVLDGMPYIVVTILFMLIFGAGIFSIILALTVTGWIGTSRLTRAQFYRYKGREYVLAARTMGVRDFWLIFRHILPNAIGPLITRAMIAIPAAIFSESFLAYIGLGIKSPESSIGLLLSEGQKCLLERPYQTIFPAILISVLMIAFNLFSNGLRDAMDPTQRGEEG